MQPYYSPYAKAFPGLSADLQGLPTTITVQVPTIMLHTAAPLMLLSCPPLIKTLPSLVVSTVMASIQLPWHHPSSLRPYSSLRATPNLHACCYLYTWLL
jgi:hypothetical protein